MLRTFQSCRRPAGVNDPVLIGNRSVMKLRQVHAFSLRDINRLKWPILGVQSSSQICNSTKPTGVVYNPSRDIQLLQFNTFLWHQRLR